MTMSARQRMGELVFGFMPSQLVHAMARLGLADVLAAGSSSPERLAEATGVPPSIILRLLRGLASVGLVRLDGTGTVSLTELGAVLVSDAPGSMRDVALHFGAEGFAAWTKFDHAVRTGELAFRAGLGTGFFEYLEEHPEAGAAFNGTMTQLSLGVVAQTVASYDFSKASRILDIGGGHGHLIDAILEANPHVAGTLFDLPHVCEAARDFLAKRPAADRCTILGGSFFEGLPPGHDVHLLKWILHDWDDDGCARILGASQAALADNGRLLVVERLVPQVIEPGTVLHPAIASDLHMLVTFGDARERTLSEYEQLLGHSGFSLVDVVPLSIGCSILVCEAS